MLYKPYKAIMNFDFKALVVKKINFKRMTPHLLVVLFFVSQLTLLTHQINHAQDNSQSTCLICLFTPNQINDNTISLTIESVGEDFFFNVKFEDVVNLLPIIHYLGRAPPVC